MKKTPWLCVISILLCAGLLFGCGKNDEEDSSGRSNRSKRSDVEASESDESEDSKESEKSKDSTKDTDATSEVTTTTSETSSETTTAPEVTTTEETLQETSQNTEIPTEPTRSLSDEEAEMSRLRDEEEDDDGEEEYEDPSGNGNGGNGGTTSTQPTYATEPDVGPDVSKPKGHWETRVISEAWDETVVDQEAWDEEVKVAVGTQWIQNDTGTDMTGWNNSQKNAWCDSHNCPNHCDEYDPSQPGYCSGNCTGKTIYETQIIHHDAVTHVVHHDAVTEEVWVED